MEGSMPLLEVLLSSESRPSRQQKRAFAAEALQIFSEELGTQRANFRLAITHIDPEDTLEVLLEEEE